MLDPKEIDIEIARLEYGESSYPAYAKLATLYTIKTRCRSKNRKCKIAPMSKPILRLRLKYL